MFQNKDLVGPNKNLDTDLQYVFFSFQENFRAIFAECGEVESVKIIQAKDGQTSTFGLVDVTNMSSTHTFLIGRVVFTTKIPC